MAVTHRISGRVTPLRRGAVPRFLAHSGVGRSGAMETGG